MELLHQNLIEYNMEQIFQTVIILFETSIRNEEWRSINLMCLKMLENFGFYQHFHQLTLVSTTY